jgi:putrescine importer
LPKTFFGYLSPRFRTPSLSIGLMGAAMMLGEWLDIDTATSCVNCGAFSAFFAVNACVVFDRSVGRRELQAGWLAVGLAFAGAAASLWLIVSLSRTALTVGALWLVVGVLFFVFRARAFRT